MRCGSSRNPGSPPHRHPMHRNPDKEHRMRIENIARLGWLALLLLLAGNASAQANLEVNTPAIAALQASMQKRHAELASLYGNGAVGLTRDGFVALRDANAVPLARRPQGNGLGAAGDQ